MKRDAHAENEEFTQHNQAQGLSSVSSRNLEQPAGTDQQEVEWQYDAPEGLEGVEEWLVSGDPEGSAKTGLAISGGGTKELADSYYDTEDWRLYRAGYGLRVRRGASGEGSEATMKSLASAGAGSNLRRRREISEPLAGRGADDLAEASGPVGERLKALLGNRELRPIFEIRTRRRVFELREERVGDDSTGKIVQDASGDIRRANDALQTGEVALDSSEIPLGGGDEPVCLTRVEVEADPSAADSPDLEKFVEAMEEALTLRPTKISKYEAGLFATGQTPETSPDLGPDAIDGSLSVGEVAFAVLRRQFAIMRVHEPGVRLGEDPEELHDMRVATRRMRAAIKLFQDALPERARWFRGELKFFAGVMGDVRDLDVQIEQLEGWASEGDEEDLEPILRIVEAIEKQRAKARIRLLEALDSARYEHFESSFAGMLRRGPTARTPPGKEPEDSPAAGQPVLDAASGLLARPYRRWRKAANRIDDSFHPEEYHELRKKGKQLRYALEFLSDVYGKETTDEFVKPLKALQDVLGKHQDSIVAGDLLEEFATGDRELSSRTVFVMGGLAERHRREAAELRASVPTLPAYRALAKGKKWKDFEKAMKKQRSGKAASKGS